MDALQTQAMQVETLSRVTRQIAQLQAARHRVDSDDYGMCEDCGEDIAKARIEMNPAVRLCVSCTGKTERRS